MSYLISLFETINIVLGVHVVSVVEKHLRTRKAYILSKLKIMKYCYSIICKNQNGTYDFTNRAYAVIVFAVAHMRWKTEMKKKT